MPFSIAIDGPAGAGKSTMARALARELGYVYVDTGAMYRAAALFCMERGIPLSDAGQVGAAVQGMEIRLAYDGEGAQRVCLDGEDVSGRIRTLEIGEAASMVSQYLPVRERLVALQQKLAKESSVVMDGRDIGTKVLPGADVKIYLTASARVRAQRRLKEIQEKGGQDSLENVERQVIERDERDMKREHSPLVQAPDAVVLDSSAMGIEETVDAMLDLVMRGRHGQGKGAV